MQETFKKVAYASPGLQNTRMLERMRESSLKCSSVLTTRELWLKEVQLSMLTTLPLGSAFLASWELDPSLANALHMLTSLEGLGPYIISYTCFGNTKRSHTPFCRHPNQFSPPKPLQQVRSVHISKAPLSGCVAVDVG